MSSGHPRGQSQPRRGSFESQNLTIRLIDSSDERFQEANKEPLSKTPDFEKALHLCV